METCPNDLFSVLYQWSILQMKDNFCHNYDFAALTAVHVIVRFQNAVILDVQWWLLWEDVWNETDFLNEQSGTNDVFWIKQWSAGNSAGNFLSPAIFGHSCGYNGYNSTKKKFETNRVEMTKSFISLTELWKSWIHYCCNLCSTEIIRLVFFYPLSPELESFHHLGFP